MSERYLECTIHFVIPYGENQLCTAETANSVQSTAHTNLSIISKNTIETDEQNGEFQRLCLTRQETLQLSNIKPFCSIAASCITDSLFNLGFQTSSVNGQVFYFVTSLS